MSINAAAAAVVAFVVASASAEAQTRPDTPLADQEAPTVVEDVTVVGVHAEQATSDYVTSVGAPANGRKLATWKQRICVGVGGMQAEPAAAIADRISDWGYSLGLRVGEPGCEPNIVILAVENGDSTARELVTRQPQNFRTGVSGTTAGTAALREFQNSGRSVRWWQVSLPVNADTLTPIVRLRGQPIFPGGTITKPSDLGSFGRSTTGSRLSDNTRDILSHVIVVIEASALDDVNFSQLTDYISMVSLAQIDANASPVASSILNLFADDPALERPETLTQWDRSYLQALYTTPQRAISAGQNRQSVADRMRSNVQADQIDSSDVD